MLDPATLAKASRLLCAVDRRSPLFRFEINESVGVVRAVFQLPIYCEARLEDDVPAAIQALVEEWTTLLPFMDRIVDGGEDADTVADDAKKAFAELDTDMGLRH